MMQHSPLKNPLGRLDDHVDLIGFMDMLMVLCCVLMITIPTYATLTSQLAKVENSSGLPPQDAPVLSFSADQDLQWDGQAITQAQLDSRLGALIRERRQPVLLLAGARDAPYGFSVQLRLHVARYGVTIKELANSTTAQPQEGR